MFTLRVMSSRRERDNLKKVKNGRNKKRKSEQD
jgi:hypothetical protein